MKATHKQNRQFLFNGLLSMLETSKQFSQFRAVPLSFGEFTDSSQLDFHRRIAPGSNCGSKWQLLGKLLPPKPLIRLTALRRSCNALLGLSELFKLLQQLQQMLVEERLRLGSNLEEMVMDITCFGTSNLVIIFIKSDVKWNINTIKCCHFIVAGSPTSARLDSMALRCNRSNREDLRNPNHPNVNNSGYLDRNGM